MNSKFMRWRHASYNTAESDIFAMINQATGQVMTEQRQIVAGIDNEVYSVRGRGSDAFILRIRQHGETSFAKEAWAIEQCRAVGVPVPEVLSVETLWIRGQSREVMVQRQLSGKPLSVLLPILSPAQLAMILAQVGRALRGIHSVTVGGFYKCNGSPGPDGQYRHWDFAIWDDVMRSHVENRKAERPFLMQMGFSEQEIEIIYQMMERYRQEFVCLQPVLCHGDFRPCHLFVAEDLTLSGVIDFGEFQGGPLIHDFADFHARCPEIELCGLLDGYEEGDRFSGTFAQQLLLHTVGSQAGYLAYCLQQNDHENADAAARVLRTSVGEWGRL